jgi:CBS domain-containing protein
MTRKRPGKPAIKDVDGMLDKALEDTFPASDPFSVGDETGTEPATRPTSRRPPAIDAERVEHLARSIPIKSRARQPRKESTMKIQEVMTSGVRLADPNQPIHEVARIMQEIDCGALPVEDNDRLVGMITDRDIALRAVATGKGPQTPVSEVMSGEVYYCFEDQQLDEIAANMADVKVRRLPVLDRNKRLVGIVSLGDIALADRRGHAAAKALSGVSEAGGPTSQSA